MIESNDPSLLLHSRVTTRVPILALRFAANSTCKSMFHDACCKLFRDPSWSVSFDSHLSVYDSASTPTPATRFLKLINETLVADRGYDPRITGSEPVVIPVSPIGNMVFRLSKLHRSHMGGITSRFARTYCDAILGKILCKPRIDMLFSDIHLSFHD